MAPASKQDVTITVYALEKSRATRVLWLLEELELPYEIKEFKRGSDMQAGPELKEIHPLGKSPVITIESPSTEKPIVLAESGPIIEYLVDHFGKDKLPPYDRYKPGCEGKVGGETESWLRERYFMHYAEGSFMPLVILQVVMDKINNAPVPFFIRPITRMIVSQVESSYLLKNVKTHLTFLEGQLESAPDGGPFLCGNRLSAADIMNSTLEYEQRYGVLNEKDYPKVTAYLKHLHERPAYKRAATKLEV